MRAPKELRPGGGTERIQTKLGIQKNQNSYWRRKDPKQIKEAKGPKTETK